MVVYPFLYSSRNGGLTAFQISPSYPSLASSAWSGSSSSALCKFPSLGLHRCLSLSFGD